MVLVQMLEMVIIAKRHKKQRTLLRLVLLSEIEITNINKEFKEVNKQKMLQRQQRKRLLQLLAKELMLRKRLLV